MVNKGRKAIEKTNQRLERLRVEYVAIDSIQPNDYNPNQQSETEYEMLRRSIEDHGFTQLVIVNADNIIVDGEHRWKAARGLGMTEIPVVKVEMTPEQMRIATLAHNKARGTSDRELEIEVLRDLERLGAIDWAQESLLLSDAEIRRLLDEIPTPESLMVDDFPSHPDSEPLAQTEPKISDLGYVQFQLVMKVDDRDRLMDTLNHVKGTYGQPTHAEALMRIIDDWRAHESL